MRLTPRNVSISLLNYQFLLRKGGEGILQARELAETKRKERKETSEEGVEVLVSHVFHFYFFFCFQAWK